MYNRGCAYGHNCTDQAARATPIDSATPNTKARTAAFVEAQATSPKPSVATSAAQAFADHISLPGLCGPGVGSLRRPAPGGR